MRILVVENDIYLSKVLSQILKKNSYTVTCVNNGDDGIDFALTGIYDIILLDVVLPKTDGMTVLQRLRKIRITTPVILLSARSEISAKVAGLDSGADDYLVKPFSLDELLARVRALGRRKGELFSNNILVYGDIELNTASLKLSTEQSEVALTCRECELLEFLIRRKGIISPKERIIEKLWGFDSSAGANHVEVYISFLRKKLEYIGSNVVITTHRGAGYEINTTCKDIQANTLLKSTV
ncbi:response regulator transcription factor [Acetivibrio cellulolyticus]|uniref:response regulator transcription factor n=1 Tax=Acetivibrio cellulolyticus TaxID=35830 RepID=UPI0001E2D8A6|nr:response regulator transcription factor [Acetivibrio cellulolyticus]